MTKNSFWEDESGAIAVDWVVLTGSLVGLGVATMAVVSGGVEDLSRDIAGQLRSDDWSMFNNGLIELSNFDFSGGDAAGWIGGQVMDMGGQIGELLVIGPQAGAAFSLEVPEGTEMAYMAFDLVAGDSLDNGLRWGVDTATLMINNVPVAWRPTTRAASSPSIFRRWMAQPSKPRFLSSNLIWVETRTGRIPRRV